MSNMKYTGYRDLLRYKFHQVWDMTAVCRKMGISYSTISKYLLEDRYCPVDLLAPLYNATKDREIYTFSTQDTVDLTVSTRPCATEQKTIVQESLDVNAAVGEFNHRFHEFQKDEKIDRGEAKALLSIVEGGLKEMEELRLRLREVIKK